MTELQASHLLLSCTAREEGKGRRSSAEDYKSKPMLYMSRREIINTQQLRRLHFTKEVHSTSAIGVHLTTLSQPVRLFSQKRGILCPDAMPPLIWREVWRPLDGVSVTRAGGTRLASHTPRLRWRAPPGFGASRQHMHSVQRMLAASRRFCFGWRTHLDMEERPWLPHPHRRGVQAILRAAPERDVAVRVPAMHVAYPSTDAGVGR